MRENQKRKCSRNLSSAVHSDGVQANGDWHVEVAGHT